MKSLDTANSKQTNQDSIKVPKVFKPTDNGSCLKTLKTICAWLTKNYNFPITSQTNKLTEKVNKTVALILKKETGVLMFKIYEVLKYFYKYMSLPKHLFSE